MSNCQCNLSTKEINYPDFCISGWLVVSIRINRGIMYFSAILSEDVDTFLKKKDRFIALRCTIVYTNYHKTVPDTSLHETSDVM
jgi:hypothetical protein